MIAHPPTGLLFAVGLPIGAGGAGGGSTGTQGFPTALRVVPGIAAIVVYLRFR